MTRVHSMYSETFRVCDEQYDGEDERVQVFFNFGAVYFQSQYVGEQRLRSVSLYGLYILTVLF